MFSFGRSTATLALTTLMIALSPQSAEAEAGRLERVRQEVREPSEESRTRSETETHRHRISSSDMDTDEDRTSGSGHHRSSNTLGKALALIFFSPLGSLGWVPYALLEHRADRSLFSSRTRFLAFPYQGGADGQMRICWTASSGDDIEPGDEEECPRDGDGMSRNPSGRRSSLRISGEYGYDLGGIHRPSLYFLIDSFFRLGVEGSWTHLVEPLSDGQLDQLDIGDLNLLFRITQHPQLQVRVGMGWRYLSDAQGLENGFNYTIGFDAFPVRPLILSLDLDIGNLGAAFLFHGRATVGVNIINFEIYGGYDVMLIGSVLFQGPIAGIRLWL